jgi:hypothetical protein
MSYTTSSEEFAKIMYYIENIRKKIKKKEEEEDVLVRLLSSAITNLPSSKNKDVRVSTSFIASLIQDANKKIKKKRKRKKIMKKKKVKKSFLKKRRRMKK